MLVKRLNKVQFRRIGAIEIPGVKTLRNNGKLLKTHCYLYKGIVPIRFSYDSEAGINHVDIYPEGIAVIPQGKVTGIPLPRYLEERLSLSWKDFAQAAMTNNIFKFRRIKEVDIDELEAALKTAYTEIYHLLKGVKYEIHFA